MINKCAESMSNIVISGISDITRNRKNQVGYAGVGYYKKYYY